MCDRQQRERKRTEAAWMRGVMVAMRFNTESLVRKKGSKYIKKLL